MKLKINKACDLNSISVLPPYTRSSAPPTGPQASQFRSQPSQQSFSQGLSSQQGMFSQLSQSSLDEVVTNDQRVNSQEQENTMKKFSSLPQVSYTREESQMPITRSSTNLMRKWNPPSAADQRSGQINEELERRIGMMETSLSRFGMILDSVQSDVIQVNRGTKEVELEVKSICQKLVVHDTSLQLMKKGQEDVKASLDGCLKSLSDQLGKNIYEDKFKEIFLVLSTLPEQIKASLLKLQNELSNFFTKELQMMACSSLKRPNQKGQSANVLSQKAMGPSSKRPSEKGVPSQKVTSRHATRQRKPKPLKNPVVPPEVCLQAIPVPKVERVGWKSVKKEQPIKERVSNEEHKRKGISSVVQARECRIITDSDEEINGGFSCLINEMKTDNENKLIDDVKEETEKILRKARRQRRKYCNPIIID